MRVVRGGKQQLIPTRDVNVGDVVLVREGDELVVDGLFISGAGLIVDESAMTGDTDGTRLSIIIIITHQYPCFSEPKE